MVLALALLRLPTMSNGANVAKLYVFSTHPNRTSRSSSAMPYKYALPKIGNGKELLSI